MAIQTAPVSSAAPAQTGTNGNKVEPQGPPSPEQSSGAPIVEAAKQPQQEVKEPLKLAEEAADRFQAGLAAGNLVVPSRTPQEALKALEDLHEPGKLEFAVLPVATQDGSAGEDALHINGEVFPDIPNEQFAIDVMGEILENVSDPQKAVAIFKQRALKGYTWEKGTDGKVYYKQLPPEQVTPPDADSSNPPDAQKTDEDARREDKEKIQALIDQANKEGRPMSQDEVQELNAVYRYVAENKTKMHGVIPVYQEKAVAQRWKTEVDKVDVVPAEERKAYLESTIADEKKQLADMQKAAKHLAKANKHHMKDLLIPNQQEHVRRLEELQADMYPESSILNDAIVEVDQQPVDPNDPDASPGEKLKKSTSESVLADAKTAAAEALSKAQEALNKKLADLPNQPAGLQKYIEKMFDNPAVTEVFRHGKTVLTLKESGNVGATLGFDVLALLYEIMMGGVVDNALAPAGR